MRSDSGDSDRLYFYTIEDSVSRKAFKHRNVFVQVIAGFRLVCYGKNKKYLS